MPAPRLPNPSTGKKDYTILVLLLVSALLHGGAVYLGAYFTAPPLPPVDNTLEIEIEGDEKEPPPLGTNDAETGPPPEAEPEPTPPPIPEDTPPPPAVVSDFEVPEEKPTPTPAATPKPKASPKPSSTPSTKPATAASPSVNPNARPGAIKGVDAAHGGVAGGTGAVKSSGGRADFVSTPNLTVPYNIKQRLQGLRVSASASITYSGGKVTDVSITRSSTNSALDALIIRHVSSNYRVKAGASGKATLPIGIKL